MPWDDKQKDLVTKLQNYCIFATCLQTLLLAIYPLNEIVCDLIVLVKLRMRFVADFYWFILLAR